MSPWRILGRLLSYRPGAFAGNVLLWGLVWTLPLASGLLTRAVLDELAGRAQVAVGLWTLIAWLVATAVVRIVIHTVGVNAWATYWFTVAGLLRRNLLDRILQRPGARPLPDSPSEAMSRFRDDVDEAAKPVELVVDGIGVVTAGVISVVIMARINAAITVVVILPLLAIVAVVALMRQCILTYRRNAREAAGRVTDFVGEMFGAVQAVKVAAAEDHVIRHLDTLNEVRRAAALKDNLLTELLTAIFRSTVNVGTGLVLILAGQSMRLGTFTVGDFALFVYYLGLVTGAMETIGNFSARMKQAGVSVQRLAELVPGDPHELLVRHTPVYLHGPLPDIAQVPRTEVEPLQILDVRDLTYRDPTTGRGIENITLLLRRGSFTVVTGRIGSGKTTLLRTLLGLLPRTGGEIRWNGALVEEPADFFVPPRAAYISQVPRLFSEALRDNVLLGLSEQATDLPGAVWSAVLERDVEALEHGLDTRVGPRGVKLSGGQVQRTAAARMFARTPELLVIDDLSSALDVDTEHTLWERLFGRPDTTCLVVSHRRAAFRRADHIIVMKDGRVETEGTLEQVLQSSPEMQRLWSHEPAAAMS